MFFALFSNIGEGVLRTFARFVPVLPITSNCTLKLSSPSLFIALHVYVPESSGPTDAMVNSPFLSSASSGRLEPSLSQMMLGVGMPEALHRNSTSSPWMTLCETDSTSISGGSRATVTDKE